MKVDMEGFFTMIEQRKSWKYSPEEQELIFAKIPQYANYEQLKSAILLNMSKTKPTGQKLIDIIWKAIKKDKVVNKHKTKQQYEGCGNCNYGYFKFPNIDRHMNSKYVYKIVNLTNIGMFPHINLRCNCTNSDNYVAHFKKLTDLYFIDPEIYEFCYLAWYYYSLAFINEIRFKNFDEFNPFRVYGYPEYEDCHLLKKDDLKYFANVIDHGFQKPRVKVPLPESTLKRINGDAVYNKKIYEEA